MHIQQKYGAINSKNLFIIEEVNCLIMSEIKTTKIIGETGVDAVNFTSLANNWCTIQPFKCISASSVTQGYSSGEMVQD